MSPPIELSSSSQMKRRRTSSSSPPVNENKKKPSQQTPMTVLPPPTVTCASPSSSSTSILPTSTDVLHPPPSAVAYYPVYTTHAGHFYIASPPLHPTSPSAHQHQHPTKILPKLPSNHHQAPPTPVTLPTSPSSSSAPSYTYYHPYQVSPPLQQMHQSAYHHYPPPQPSAMTMTSTADQREHARKVSHSAIERRRRERINDKIMQLKQLIPTCADQENLHKMSILQSAIEYITYLKEILDDSDDNIQGRQPLPIKLNWDLKKNKNSGIESPPPMLPTTTAKAVHEPYISQFSIQQYPTTTTTTITTTTTTSTSEDSSPQKDILPQPQPQPHTQQQCLKPMDIFMSTKNKKPVSMPDPVSNATSTSSKSPSLNETTVTTKNMSLKNLLC